MLGDEIVGQLLYRISILYHSYPCSWICVCASKTYFVDSSNNNTVSLVNIHYGVQCDLGAIA